MGFTLGSLTPRPTFTHKVMLHKDGLVILAVGPEFLSIGWGKSVDLKEWKEPLFHPNCQRLVQDIS